MSDEIIAQILLLCFQVIKEKPSAVGDVAEFAIRMMRTANSRYHTTGV